MLIHLFIFSGRKKDKFIPAELRDQWERDRAKKAERKRLRELERNAAMVDPFTTRKGNKKARKAKRAPALATSVSLETIVGHMRRFVADIGGARSLPLPPMNRSMRKSVHELAHAFRLESKSRGNGAERFTTLMKTTLSGVNVDEKWIARILGKSSLSPCYLTREGGKEKGKGKGVAGRTRPRDGEVVGEVQFSRASSINSALTYILRLHPSLTGRTSASGCYLPWDGKKVVGLESSEGWKRL